MAVDTRTEVGNYFVSNYPPFSQWKPEFIPKAIEALNQPARVDDPLGLYIHIPFCRKRCHFCYFKVYTDKNASEIEVYLDALIKENELYSRMPAFAGRQLRLLRWRHAVLHQRQAVALSRRRSESSRELAKRRRGHFRVRAGNVAESE